MRLYSLLLVMLCSISAMAQFDYEAALHSLNELRDEGCNCGNQVMRPASELNWDKKLASIAQDYADQLSAANQNKQQHVFLSHVGTDGTTLEDRLMGNDYEAKACVENIAYFRGNFDMVIDHWLNNPQMCKNLLDRRMTMVGAAQRGDYWVVILAVPRKN